VEQQEGKCILVGQREVGDGAVQRLQLGAPVGVLGLGGAHKLAPGRRRNERLLELLQELLHAAGYGEHVVHQTLLDKRVYEYKVQKLQYANNIYQVGHSFAPEELVQQVVHFRFGAEIYKVYTVKYILHR